MKKVYILKLGCIDNFGKGYETYIVCTTKDGADAELARAIMCSTEIVSHEIIIGYAR